MVEGLCCFRSTLAVGRRLSEGQFLLAPFNNLVILILNLHL